MLRLVSYSYPPDSTPAAHRPRQLALALHARGEPFLLHTRHGTGNQPAFFGAISPVGAGSPSREGSARKAFGVLSKLLSPLLEIDKALLWGVRVFPGVWVGLLRSWLIERKRPDIWATCPGITNLYVGGLAAMLSGSRLHVDLRDAIRGIGPERMPLLTWLVLRYASTCSVVTDSLAQFVRRRAPFLSPVVIYNGVAGDSVAEDTAHVSRGDRWIRVTYAGAIYGGARPYELALSILREVASGLDASWQGVELVFVGREDISSIIDTYQSSRFRIIHHGEIPKAEALRMSATSDINLVLIGVSHEHRCAIPLKVFDLLGAGRPVLYLGPMDADGLGILDRFMRNRYLAIDCESSGSSTAPALVEWLAAVRDVETAPATEPSAALQSQRILDLIRLGSHRVEAI